MIWSNHNLYTYVSYKRLLIKRNEMNETKHCRPKSEGPDRLSPQAMAVEFSPDARPSAATAYFDPFIMR